MPLAAPALHDSATKKSTKSKARRLIRSEIVAFNVQKVTKRSQYWSSIDPEVNQELEQVLAEAKELAREKPDAKNKASQLGLLDVPAPESPGGVIAFGPIERTAIIALSGVRALVTFKAATAAGVTEIDTEKTLALRRYLFALALASAADPGVWDLREGCILVRAVEVDKDGKELPPFTVVKVKHSGGEDPFTMPTKSEPSEFLAKAAAAFFGEREANGVQVTEIPSPLVLAPEFVKALLALPAYEGKEAELNKEKVGELKKLWEEAKPKSGDAPITSEASTDAEETATGDDDAES